MFIGSTKTTFAAVLFLLAAACGGEKRPPAAPPVDTSPTPPATVSLTSETVPSPKQVSPTLSVSDQILEACKLHFDSAGKAPKFDFNRSDLLPADEEVLREISHCLMSGPLQGRAVELIGRADPRGTSEYNMALGALRAHSVARFIQDMGVKPTQIRETSRGELDATGYDETTWELDRRVDIVLVE